MLQIEESAMSYTFDRNFVYKACLMAESEGEDCGDFADACSKNGNDAFLDKFYQDIADKYRHKISTLSLPQCWEIYQNKAKIK